MSASPLGSDREGGIGRQQFPAPGHEAVKAALDAVRVTLSEIGEWLRKASSDNGPVASGTLNNYRDGRREMPSAMRGLLAKQLRRHAQRLRAAARDLEKDSGGPIRGTRRPAAPPRLVRRVT